MNTANSDIMESITSLQTLIETKKDGLVERVKDFFDNRGTDPKVVVPVKNTQLQNLLQLALQTTSVKEIQLFIHYQCGRDKDNREWGKNDFGLNLEKQVGEVGEVAEETMEGKDVNIELVRLFLGYLVWEARYRNPDQKKSERR